MKTTEELRKVLKSHSAIVKVDLPLSNDASLFWEEIATWADNMPSEKFKHTGSMFRSFAKNDTLEIMNRQGRILKRFAKYVKKSYEIELTSSEMGVIGDLLQYYISKNGYELYIDFTGTFDWEDGQFGKTGSCYWGCYSDSIPTLENAGAYAMRFYRDFIQDDSNGLGRTWVYPKDGRLYCFNSYGVERAKVSRALKIIFARYEVELHFKTIELTNSQSDTIPYINSGTGFCMYQEGDEIDSDKESIDLDLEVIENSKETCVRCCGRYHRDEMSEVYDEWYCGDCYDERFSSCERCGSTRDRDEMITVSDSRFNDLCQSCAQYLDFTPCHNCGEYVCSYITTEDTGNSFCDGCQDDLYYCNTCDKYYQDEDNDDCQEETETEETQKTEEVQNGL